MKLTPEEMRSQYEKTCTNKRIRGVVYSIDGSVVFNGKSKKSEGINAAKRYVRKHSLKSFTVKD